MLMRKTSAPALNRRAIMAASEEDGPNVATILARRNRLMTCVSFFAAVCWSRRRRHRRPLGGGRRALRQGPGRLLFGAVGQLHGPGALFTGIDLEEAGLVEAARQAILGAANGEFLLA